MEAPEVFPWLADFSGATLDSRLVRPGMLFVAIKGEKVDGRAFIPQALAAGAVGVLEGREALAVAARAYRATLTATVVGVTGSAGKTTVKEMTAAFLRTLRRADGSPVVVHATSGNYNNDLGLPLTILNCPRNADFLVLEMGTNHPGEIAYLTEIAQANVGLISSIGSAHIAFFGTQENIAREKGTLFASLKPHAVHGSFAVISRTVSCRAILESLAVSEVVLTDETDAAAQALSEVLAVRLPGVHNVSNARIAWACAQHLGASLEDCVRVLESFSLPGKRWNRVTRAGVSFIEDCYNANPASMTVALESFAAQPCAGRRFVVLGDMLELGDQTHVRHLAVLDDLKRLGIDQGYLVGSAFAEASSHAKDCPAGLHLAPDAESVRVAIFTRVQSGDAVLIKGSHGIHLERILAD